MIRSDAEVRPHLVTTQEDHDAMVAAIEDLRAELRNGHTRFPDGTPLALALALLLAAVKDLES